MSCCEEETRGGEEIIVKEEIKVRRDMRRGQKGKEYQFWLNKMRQRKQEERR